MKLEITKKQRSFWILPVIFLLTQATSIFFKGALTRETAEHLRNMPSFT